MKKNESVLIIGIGAFGLDLVRQFKRLGAEVIALDKDPTRANLVADIADRVFACDSSNRQAMEDLGIDKVDHAVVAMGQGTSASAVSTITTIVTLKKLGIKDIVVRLDDEEYRDAIEDLGANFIFSPVITASEKLSNIVLADTYEDYFGISNEYSVLKIEAADTFQEVSLFELNAPKKFDVIILLIQRGKKTFMPKRDDTIKPGDQVYAFGTTKHANNLAKHLAK